MWPIVYDFGLVRIFGIEFHLAIYSYGLMLVVAFYTCYALLYKEMERLKYDQNLFEKYQKLWTHCDDTNGIAAHC